MNFTKFRDGFLNGNVYGFLFDYSSIDKFNILNIQLFNGITLQQLSHLM